MTLPNHRSLDDYKDEAQRLARQAARSTSRSYEKYRARRWRSISATSRDALTGKHLYELANAIEVLLNDRGRPEGSGKKPNMVEFWEQPDDPRAARRGRQVPRARCSTATRWWSPTASARAAWWRS